MKNTRLRPANKQSEKRESWMLLLLSLWLFFQCLFHGRDDQRGKKKTPRATRSLSVCLLARANDIFVRIWCNAAFSQKEEEEKKKFKIPSDSWSSRSVREREEWRSEGWALRPALINAVFKSALSWLLWLLLLFIYLLSFFLFLCVEVKKMKKRKEKKEREI